MTSSCFFTLPLIPQEVSSGNRVMCGSVVLNGEPGILQHRIANALYDSCRAGSGVCPHFPNFDPVVSALRESAVVDSNVTYKVCVAKQDKLVVLQSLARRWTEYEASKEEAVKLIEEHNKHFNPDGDFMENDERTGWWNIFQHWPHEVSPWEKIGHV